MFLVGCAILSYKKRTDLIDNYIYNNCYHDTDNTGHLYDAVYTLWSKCHKKCAVSVANACILLA